MFPSTTLNVNITILFCGLHTDSMLLLLPTAATKNVYPVNIFRSSSLSRKCQSSHFLFCIATVLLRWSLQYGRRWFQFPTIDDRSSPIFQISAPAPSFSTYSIFLNLLIFLVITTHLMRSRQPFNYT